MFDSEATRGSRLLVTVLLFVAAGALLTYGQVDPQDTQGFSVAGIVRSIESALTRSPDDYVAALVETMGQPVCSVEDGESLCWVRVQVLELMAGKTPTEAAWPDEFKLLSGDPAELNAPFQSQHYLLFAMPLSKETDVYGAAYMTVDTSRQELEKFREALEQAHTE